MSATTDSLTISRDNLLAKIEEVTANPKPNYSIDGQSVSHASFLESLIKSVELLEARIAVNDPAEVISQIY